VGLPIFILGATTLETAKQADGEHVRAIRLGGSKTRLVFD